MAFEFIEAKEIQEMINKDFDFDPYHIEVMQHILWMADCGDFTVFYNKENKKWFAVVKGEPVPKHMEAEILGL